MGQGMYPRDDQQPYHLPLASYKAYKEDMIWWDGWKGGKTNGRNVSSTQGEYTLGGCCTVRLRMQVQAGDEARGVQGPARLGLVSSRSAEVESGSGTAGNGGNGAPDCFHTYVDGDDKTAGWPTGGPVVSWQGSS